ncbi:ECF RNA polymerase sigma-E factor [Enhygromyxa salina]|uniref:ECF RNA polymerase sigma-E factor n=1 Tax=Enhygromyxa salina TaxID=215803 RepID=A0A2S9YX38_9BACT|nr:ECF RNA polymerase sigma-E factor [Enhygromyxa salina]
MPAVRDDTDLQLIERWREGDRRAGNLLVDRYFAQLRAFFLTAVGDADREDLVQETFRRLVSAVPNFEGRSSFRTYLFKIARFTLLDFLRQRYRGKGEFDPMLHSVEDVDGVSPSHLVTAIERHQQLLGCVRKLPVETKQLLELYYWHDHTAAELAEGFGIPERTLRSRLVAARNRLHACMQDGAAPTNELDLALEGQLRQIGEFLRSGRVT